uniref:Uncharacterized protein n=1 Tax=uncultured Rhizobiales bacterium HF4000_32B18 TaxID=710780 RepID=E0XWD7_9HYPH|nr:hypothetical protein [uncultured Rhizobiales bacterium HF4000_32B18]
MARIVFHVGMGKTGTTSLQRALGGAGAALGEQKARYLGMWFERLGAGYEGFAGLRALARADAAEQQALAERFAAGLLAEAAASGVETFVHSNESIFERAAALTPFFERLAARMPVGVVAYLRPPREWLPSAFAQWGVWHKTQPGPVPDFATLAGKLIRTYDAITVWPQVAGVELVVRRFGRDTEIVADFGAAAGLALPAEPTRHQTRAEPAEMVLRGLYNDRFQGPVMPGQFNATVLKAVRTPVPSVARMAALTEDREGLEAIVARKRDTFAFIEARFGIDMLGEPPPAPGPVPDPEAAGPADGRDGDRDESGPRDARLIDFLVELTLAQSIRITRLERTVEGLSQALAERDAGEAGDGEH